MLQQCLTAKYVWSVQILFLKKNTVFWDNTLGQIIQVQNPTVQNYRTDPTPNRRWTTHQEVMIFVGRYFFCFDRFCFCHLQERPPVAHLQLVHVHLQFGPGREPGRGRGIGFHPSIGSCTISSGLFSISMFDLDVRNPGTCKTTMKNAEVQHLLISD